MKVLKRQYQKIEIFKHVYTTISRILLCPRALFPDGHYATVPPAYAQPTGFSVYVFAYIYKICKYKYISIPVYTYTFTHIHTCIHIYMYVYKNVHKCDCMCTYIKYLHMYTYLEELLPSAFPPPATATSSEPLRRAYMSPIYICKYQYICIYVYTYIYIYMYGHRYIDTYIYIYIYISIYKYHVCLYTHIYIYIRILFAPIYMSIYTYVYIYSHIICTYINVTRAIVDRVSKHDWSLTAHTSIVQLRLYILYVHENISYGQN
jgi:hypothetical protein